ncbi:MAG TPA: radical SAM protein [Nitrospirota bacterium]
MVFSAKTLSAPLRVYWALAPADHAGLSPGLALDAASELAGLKVFFVTLRLLSGPRDDLREIVGRLKKGGVRVTVSFSGVSCFSGFDDVSGADGIDLSPADPDALDGLLKVLASAPKGKPLSVSVVPERGNIDAVARIIARSLDAGIRVFAFPNPDLVSEHVDADRFVLDDADRGRLKAEVETLLVPYGKDVKLSVHDLFLHKSLELPGLGAVVEYAGCQAGDAIAFIDHAGLVYPCSTWPEPLGRLGPCTFRDVWSSESRSMMREAVSRVPDGCAGCPEARVCKGGCAGLAFAMGRPGGRDPGCGLK